MNNSTQKPDNNLVWAILSTLFCCLPFGIVAIVYAAKVDGLWNSGDQDGARDAAEKAKKYSLWGAILGGAFALIYFILLIVGILV